MISANHLVNSTAATLFQLVPDEKLSYKEGMLEFKAAKHTVDQTVVVNAFWIQSDPPLYGFDFFPEGLAFNLPVELSYRLDPDALEEADIDPSSLSIFYVLDDGTYEELPTDLGMWDWTGDFKLTCNIYHFSKYLIAVGPPPDRNSAN